MTHNHNYHTIDHSLTEAQHSIARLLGIDAKDVSIAINERDNIIYASALGASATYELGKMRDAPFKAVVHARIAEGLKAALKQKE